MNGFILKGNICYSKSINKIEVIPNGYVICIDGKSLGAFKKLPNDYLSLPIHNYGDRLIIPGLIDLHIHAPQYAFRGINMDMGLMDWLQSYAFPEEKKYSDIKYAEKAYKIFTNNLLKGATTRACVFATVHTHATILLMDIIEKTGLIAYVGKISMDRNAPDDLCEGTLQAKKQIDFWLHKTKNAYKNVNPILTPRFIPCCTNELLNKISVECEKFSIPIQSHLSENPSEIKLVSRLCPESDFYGDAYDRRGLFGVTTEHKNKVKTIMAHCVHSNENEIKRMAENGVFAAHCPASNINLCSGIAPIRKMTQMGVKIGLGTDVAGGHSDSVFQAIVNAIQASKLYSCLIDKTKKPLTFAESFYMATKGGGEFFGRVGSFEKSYDFDAVVLDDSNCASSCNISILNRLERYAYLNLDINGVDAKYARGKKIYSKN